MREERRIPCPCCDSLDYKFIYEDCYGNVHGCSECLTAIDEQLYQEETEQKLYDEHINALVDEAVGK